MSTPAAEARAWPFADLSFWIVRTQEKVATHEHLSSLKADKFGALKTASALCVESFRPGHSAEFLKHLAVFTAELRRQGLQAPLSLSLTSELESQSWCRLAKGCGAFGADTLVVFALRADRDFVMSELQNRHLEIVATEDALSAGLQMHWSWDEN
jgi:hypothetical protein